MKKIIPLLFLLCSIQLHSQENITEILAARGTGVKTRAIIVANEDYQSYSPVYVENEVLAIQQAEKFRQMLIRKLGVLPENIQFYPDALTTHIKLAITKLQRDLPADANVIFYYRGKLYNDENQSDTWIVPVDVSDNETFYMLSMEDLCTRLNTINKTGITIILDSYPGKNAGISSILENGFVREELPITGTKNMDFFTLKIPPAQAPQESKVSSKKPLLSVTEPGNRSTDTRESVVTIKGRVESDCEIEVMAVNGQESHFTANGEFMARVNLDEGENIIAIEARNCAGWSRDYVIFNLLSPEPVITADISELEEYGRNYAVVIGVSKYSDPVMPDLYYPIFDARKVAQVLTDYYTFEKKNVLLLENPTKLKITMTLDSLEGVISADDNMLIFYAGHGTWDEKKSTGYWLPSDAAARTVDNWLMNKIITAYVSESKAKHSLVIADACFGGSIFRTRALPPEEIRSLSELYSRSSRKAMTSGDLMEVPDESVFVKTFLEQLTDNQEKYISTEKLFFGIKPYVVNEADLIPQFGIIKNSGDQGGDFIFFRKDE